MRVPFMRCSLVILLLLHLPVTASATINLSSFSATPVNHTLVHLNWTTLTEITNFGFEIQRSANSQANYQTLPGTFIPGNGTTSTPHNYAFTDSNAAPGVWYYRLRQIDLGGPVHYSYGVLATVPAEQPSLVAPADNATGIPLSALLRWLTSSGATSYHLQVCLDTLFSSLVVDEVGIVDTTFQTNPLAYSTEYFWRVRSIGSPLSSAFSETRSFTTTPMIAQPLLVIPVNADVITSNSVQFVWRQVAGMNAYWLEVSTDSLFNAPAVDSTLTDTMTVMNGLQHQQTYWWRVRAGIGPSSWGPYSSTRTFSVNFTISVSLQNGWNMISHPVLNADDSLHQLYPGAASSTAFSFNPASGYVPQTRLQNGEGYWAKFGSAGINPIIGDPILADSIPVVAGWNIIGSISASVDTGDVVTTPPGIRSSPFYGYSSGIVSVPTIEPGKAYWVKFNAPGLMILTGDE